ncbi:MAG: hypothetical protein O3C68_04510 [Proteobacteria bacterium]|nr:hypothetical protein [Pseudomonadota bacterium]
MSLEDLGNIGDFLGGIGVALTVIYLALQIRQNTKSVESNTLAAKAQMRFQIATDAVQSIRSVRMDDSLLDAFVKVADGKELDSKDLLLIDLYAREIFRSAEGNFFQHRNGSIDEEEFEGMLMFYKDSFQSPSMKSFWHDNKHQFPSAFITEVDGLIDGDA